MNLYEQVKCPCCDKHHFVLFYGHQMQSCFEFDNTKITKDDLLPRLVLRFWCQTCEVEFNWTLCQKFCYGVSSIDFNISITKAAANENLPQKRKSLPSRLRYQILSRDNYACQACGARAENGALLEVDHIYPVSRGGTNEPENLRTLCRTCNRGKGDKIYDNN
jgi:hypothetical protein